MPEWRDRSAQYCAYGSRRNPTAGRTPNAAQVFCTRSSIVASAIERADMLKVSIDAPLPDRTALFLDVDGTLLDLLILLGTLMVLVMLSDPSAISIETAILLIGVLMIAIASFAGL